MSKTAICEAVYDAMVERGLSTEHEAFEDILIACCSVAEQQEPRGVDVLAWVEQQERARGLDSIFAVDQVPPRSAVQVYLDWRAYLDKCAKKTMKLTALLTVLVEVGAAHAD